MDVFTLCFSKKLPATGNLAFILEGKDLIWNAQCFPSQIQRAGLSTVYTTLHHHFYVKNANCETQDFTHLIFWDIAGVRQNAIHFQAWLSRGFKTRAECDKMTINLQKVQVHFTIKKCNNFRVCKQIPRRLASRCYLNSVNTLW